MCHAHLVFVTKYRKRVFTSAALDVLKEVMQKVCDDFGVELAVFEGEDNHAIGATCIRLMEACQGRAKPERSDSLMRWNLALC